MAQNLRYRRNILTTAQVPQVQQVGVQEQLRTADAMTRALDSLVGYATQVGTGIVEKQRKEMQQTAGYEASVYANQASFLVKQDLNELKKRVDTNLDITDEQIDEQFQMILFSLEPLMRLELQSGSKTTTLANGIIADAITRLENIKNKKNKNYIIKQANEYQNITLPRNLDDIQFELSEVLDVDPDEELNMLLFNKNLSNSKLSIMNELHRHQLLDEKGNVSQSISNQFNELDNILPNAIVKHIVEKLADNAYDANEMMNNDEVGAFSKVWETMSKTDKENIRENVSAYYANEATAYELALKQSGQKTDFLLTKLQQITIRDADGNIIPEKEKEAKDIISQIKTFPLDQSELKYVEDFFTNDVSYDPAILLDVVQQIESNLLDKDDFLIQLQKIPQKYHPTLIRNFSNTDAVFRGFNQELNALSGTITEDLGMDIINEINKKEIVQAITNTKMKFVNELVEYRAKNDGVEMPNNEQQKLADDLLLNLRSNQEPILINLINSSIDNELKARLKRVINKTSSTEFDFININYVLETNVGGFIIDIEKVLGNKSYDEDNFINTYREIKEQVIKLNDRFKINN